MSKVYLVYTGDLWATPSRRALIAVATTHKMAADLAAADAAEKGHPLSPNERETLLRENELDTLSSSYYIIPSDTDTKI